VFILKPTSEVVQHICESQMLQPGSQSGRGWKAPLEIT